MNAKLIKIKSNGPIYAKGGVYGPIETPYAEDLGTVFRMLSAGVKIVEVLEDGTEVVLTVSNFDKNNAPKKEEKAQEPAKDQTPPPAKPPAQQQQQQQQQVKNQQGNQNNHGNNHNQQQGKNKVETTTKVEVHTEKTAAPEVDSVETK